MVRRQHNMHASTFEIFTAAIHVPGSDRASTTTTIAYYPNIYNNSFQLSIRLHFTNKLYNFEHSNASGDIRTNIIVQMLC